MFNTLWGMASSSSNKQIASCLPPPVFGTYFNFIGMQCNATVPVTTLPDGPFGWFKEGGYPSPPLFPRDLHQAMLERRLGSNGTYP